MPNRHSSGRWAIAGFLYQILGMLSIVASSLDEASFTVNEDESNLSLSLFDVGENFQASHEWFEDAAFTVDDECVLVQFKYSSTGNKINKTNAKEIIEDFNNSHAALDDRGFNVTACVLFTNRELTSKGGNAAKQYWESIDTPESFDLRYHKTGEIGDLIRDLHIFCRKYGMFQGEIEDGIEKLIGRILLQTGDLFQRKVDQSDFLDCLIGSENAQPITIEEVLKEPDQRLEELKVRIGVNHWNGNLYKRSVLREVIDAIHKDRALIALHGAGGCGKSTIIWQIFNSTHRDQCYMYTPAEELSENWVEYKINKWRGLLSHPADTRPEAIKRLLIANPNAPQPVLWLGLDGIDEGYLGPQRRDNIREILRWFWRKDRDRFDNKPKATLIVTTRKRDDLNRFLRLGGMQDQSDSILSFRVSNFTVEERNDVALRAVPNIYRSAFSQKSRHEVMQVNNFDKEIYGADVQDAQDINMESFDDSVWESLEHPVMWRAFLSMDDNAKKQALEGVDDAKHELAHEFIMWFRFKLDMRHGASVNYLVNNDGEELFRVLENIAIRSDPSSLNQSEAEWIEPAGETTLGLGSRMADILYKESLSAGLISEDEPRRWRWRHLLVYEYLIRNE